MYSSLAKTIKSFGIKAEIRAEETFVKGNSVTSGQKFSNDHPGFFPSVFLLKLLVKKRELS
jgi:hypothetical protein